MNSAPVPAVRLSCEQCKQRKKKCDKQIPCTACRHSGFTCASVQRARKPRGKLQHKGDEIDTRVARLEDLVKQLKAQIQIGNEHEAAREGTLPPALVSQGGKSSNGLQGYIASDFWEEISQETNGIRKILEEPDKEDASEANLFTSSWPTKESYFISGSPLFSHGSSVTEGTPQNLNKYIASTLLSIYQYRVDSIFKVLHWPSVNVAIHKKNTEAGTEGRWTGVHALNCAIQFTALCTMTDPECEQQLYCKKSSLLLQLKIAAESSISKAKLLEYPDLTVLQAYVVYLIGLRCSTTEASSWTLLPIAVRLATALKLGSEDLKSYLPYELEIRRRLWFSIGLLDTQLALDRGSIPLLHCRDFISWPLTVDDSDLYPACSQLTSSQIFTDMTFSSMTHRAMMCQKKLYETNTNRDDPWASWNEKIAAISAYEDYVKSDLSSKTLSPTPLERFTQAVGEGSLLNIKLMLRRPLHRTDYKTVPPWDDYNIISESTKILERSLYKKADINFAPWAWFAWVKWYALAVLLAELYSSGTSTINEHSYLVAQETFAQYAPMVADSESGMLWKPIVKLMRRLERLRGSRVNETAHDPWTSSQSTDILAKAGTVTDLNALEDFNPNPPSVGQDPGNSLRLDLFDPTVARPASTICTILDTDNTEQIRMETALDDDPSLINWDIFLEDMFNSANMDCSMDWENNDYTASS